MTALSLPFPERRHLSQDQVYRCLSDGAWWTAKRLSVQTGFSDRQIRSIAEDSHGQIVSSDRGYKRIQYATVAELEHAENRLRSQARCMLRRVVQMRTARNRVLSLVEADATVKEP